MKKISFLLALFGISFLSTTIYTIQNYNHQIIERIRYSVNQNLSQSFVSSSMALHELKQIAATKQLKTNASPYSLHNTLKAISRDFGLSRTSLYNKSCELIASSEKGILLDKSCQTHSAPIQWQISDGKLNLFRYQVLEETPQQILEIKNVFDLDSLNPVNSSLFNLEVEESPSPHPMVPIVAGFQVKISSPSLLNEALSKEPHPGYLWISALSILIALGTIFRHYYLRSRDRHILESRLKKHFLDHLSEPSLNKLSCMELMKRSKAKWIEDDFEFRKKLKSHEDQKARLEEQIIDLKKVLSTLKSQESLHEQIAGGAEQFIKMNQDNLSKIEDISDIILQGILNPCQEIFKIIRQWHLGLQESSPRKHFRSLSERPSGTHSNQLDEDIHKLLTSCQSLGSLSMELGVHSQKLQGQIQQGQKIANHWLNMIIPSGAPKDLEDIILDAQILVPLSEDKLSLNFDNLMTKPVSIDNIDIPASTWSSIIYHLYLASLAPFGKTVETITIQTNSYIKEGKSLLIITAKSARHIAIGNTDDGQQHFRLAQEMARNSGIEVFNLPAPEGNHPIAVCWEDHKSKSSRSSKIPSISKSSSPSKLISASLGLS